MDNETDTKQLTEPQAWVDEICSVTGLDYRIRTNAGRAARLGKELREAGGTVPELHEHFGVFDCGAVWWWWRDDWRGKRGQRPGLAQIAECWGAWTLPIAVTPQTSAGSLLDYAMELRRNENNNTVTR